jgi:pimeloyl-ACP methyl ester carboxylesterase
MWEYQMTALASAGYRCIAHDRRGFGRSDQPWHGYDYDTFADDVCDIIERLDLRDVTLVGFSMGGGEVARYIGKHGTARVSKAVLLAAVTPLLLKKADHPEGVDMSVFDGMRAGIIADRAQFFIDFGKVFTGANRPGANITQGMADWTQSMLLQASLKGTLDCTRAFSETDFRDDLKKFSVPTLIIHGDDDQIVPIDITSRAAAKLVPSSRLEVLSGASHALYFTHKDKINADLMAFVG